MSALTNYAENKIIDAVLRGQALGAPATAYMALIVASRGFWVATTAYALNDYVLPIGGNGHLYKCTTAGTSSGSAPTWNTGAGSTTSDGTVVWTEISSELEAGTAPEVTGGAYARQSITASLANWAGTQGAGTTVASSGTGGSTSNNNSITFPNPSANWGVIFGYYLFDALTVGNAWIYGALTNPQTVNNGNSGPSAAAGAITFQIDN